MSEFIAILGGGAGIAAILAALPPLMRSFRSMKSDLATAAAELSPNHGGSMKDGVTATRQEVAVVSEKLDLLISSSSDTHKLMLDHLRANDRDIAAIRKELKSIPRGKGGL
ncbi:hypothetical protein ACRQEE_01260 [Actinotignum sp. GS-2025c]|uniref:hypothetical protein n=1 Tax=Actinotignum TaxID=1653174 RepID=UPI00237DE80A|nr:MULTISPECIES: hypothetical protein [Actinotignum]MDE1641797.1 hypothetical protein [Actinotignum sanguinis]MDE1654322.1 hypothetical protein [Actinotignum schaalii]